MEAVVARAMESLHASLLAAMATSEKGPDEVAALLDGVFDAMVGGGHARTFLWLALSGYDSSLEQLQIRSLAEAVHEIRRARRSGKKRMPPFEDTYFTVLLAALALLTLSVTDRSKAKKGNGEPCGARRFRLWLGELIHAHLEEA